MLEVETEVESGVSSCWISCWQQLLSLSSWSASASKPPSLSTTHCAGGSELSRLRTPLADLSSFWCQVFFSFSSSGVLMVLGVSSLCKWLVISYCRDQVVPPSSVSSILCMSRKSQIPPVANGITNFKVFDTHKIARLLPACGLTKKKLTNEEVCAIEA